MATIESAAAWRVGKPIALAACAVVLSLALSGCSGTGNLFGSGDTAAPAAEVAPAAAPPAAPQMARIAVASVIGPSEGVAQQLEQQVGAALTRQNVSVAKSPAEKAEYTLRGYLVSAREKSGTKVSHIWDLTDPSGKRVNRITGEELVPGAQGKDPWAAVTPQMVEQIAAKTAGSLATWLPTQATPGAPASGAIPVAGAALPPPPAAAGAPMGAALPPVAANTAVAPAAGPATRAPVQQAAATIPAAATGAALPGAGATTTASISREAVLVPSVTGAPGDGSVSLTGAIQRELSKSGVALTDKVAPGQTFKVEGKVVVGQGKDGKQPIAIDWDVKDPKGKKLGTVQQKNEIPQGSVDGAWGKTADAAAAAAAQGILRLLPNQVKAN